MEPVKEELFIRDHITNINKITGFEKVFTNDDLLSSNRHFSND